MTRRQTGIARPPGAPLTIAQRGVWFAEQLWPGSPAYHLAVTLALDGPLDAGLFQRSVDRTLERHAALRTSFREAGGGLVQRVEPDARLEVVFDAIEAQDAKSRSARLEAAILEQVRTPFCLAEAPLARVSVFQVGELRHYATVAAHHLISDAWSVGVLLAELAVTYSALLKGEEPPFTDPPPQYVDYAVGEEERLARAGLSDSIAHGCARLRGAELTEIPPDRPRLPSRTRDAAVHRFEVPRDLTKQLKELRERENTTVFTTLLAALYVLLHRCTGQEDLLVTCPVSNRTAEQQSAMGLFTNLLPLRADLSGNPSFLDLVRRLRKVRSDAMAHRHLPFELLLSKLDRPRDLLEDPLTRVLFSYVNFPMAEVAFGDLTVSDWELHGGGSLVSDFTFSAREFPDGLTAWIHYDPSCFDSPSIERLGRQYLSILQTVSSNPRVRVSEICVDSPAETDRLLSRLRGRSSSQHPRCVVSLIDERIEEQPAHVAVSEGDRSWTYAELSRRVDEVRSSLHAVGIRRGSTVAIHMDRSFDAVCAILAISRCGSAVLPLDPSYPEARLRFMIDDARPDAILTGNDDAQLRSPLAIPVIDLSEHRGTHPAAGAASPLVEGHDTAYVAYTSGSTGQPKGIVVPHRVLRNLVAWQMETSGPVSRSATLHAAPLSFDVAFQEIFSTLCAGGRLVVLSNDDRLDARAVLRTLRREHVQRAFLPPVMLRQLAETASSQGAFLPELREINVSGEQLQISAAIESFMRRHAHCSLWNQYGPTETHVVTAQRLEGDPGEWERLPPIGCPISNAHLYVIDRFGQLAPRGGRGELYVGGPCVASGYVRRPRETRERFVPDPQGREGTVFRTGDLVRVRSDGTLSFLGRADQQIKLRGFRIEPREIELALAAHPGIEQAVVVARRDPCNEVHLVAYLQHRAGAEVSQADLSEHLRQRLPAYMVPSCYVPIDAIPLTPSGKVDASSLPEPPRSPNRPAEEIVAPRDELERELLCAWSELLEMSQLGVRDGFFDLGGDSLAALQLAVRVSEIAGHEVSVRLILEHPTVESTAAAIRAGRTQAETTAPAIRTRSADWLRENHVEVIDRSLLESIEAGAIEPVDSAALAYVDERLRRDDGTPMLGDDGGPEQPSVVALHETTAGRIATILLPIARRDLYAQADRLDEAFRGALELARRIGARAVSLTGLLPSATGDYGQRLAAEARALGLPAVTTGHGMTVAAVGFAVEQILGLAGRRMSEEVVGVIGLGSIGTASLELVLESLPHPKELLLCDVFDRAGVVGRMARRLERRSGFRGALRVLPSRGDAPASLYEASVIIGATNCGEILDVGRLRPGTLVVDDSSPHCFSPDGAMRRMRGSGDVLLVEGGILASASALRHFVARAPGTSDSLVASAFPWRKREITGCVLSSALTALGAAPPTVGPVDVESAIAHRREAARRGFTAAAPQCEKELLPEPLIADFRARYGA